MQPSSNDELLKKQENDIDTTDVFGVKVEAKFDEKVLDTSTTDFELPPDSPPPEIDAGSGILQTPIVIALDNRQSEEEDNVATKTSNASVDTDQRPVSCNFIVI